jgi:TBC1 domain family protein 5
MDTKGLPDNPLGRVTLDKAKLKAFLFSQFSREWLTEKAVAMELTRCGSRVTAWQFMLGILPQSSDPQAWMAALKSHRDEFSALSQKYSLKSMRKLDPNVFNPLAPPSKQNGIGIDIELRDIIEKDIVRTFQEYAFFKAKKYQEQLKLVLYYWAKEHAIISYRQGMNEILALIFFAVYAELTEREEETT